MRCWFIVLMISMKSSKLKLISHRRKNPVQEHFFYRVHVHAVFIRFDHDTKYIFAIVHIHDGKIPTAAIACFMWFGRPCGIDVPLMKIFYPVAVALGVSHEHSPLVFKCTWAREKRTVFSFGYFWYDNVRWVGLLFWPILFFELFIYVNLCLHF